MDSYKAKQIEQILKGKSFHGYEVLNLLDNGKSAAVFKAKDSKGQFYALKIFDNDLLKRFGHEIQEKRITQEISLKNHTIQNLVKIVDGGREVINGEEYYFILMEFINGKNLKTYIQQHSYGNSFLQKVVGVLYTVTNELLEIGIAHRDIKPENIMVTENEGIILMDLGVLKLIGAPSFSDQDERQFVGTLRYAPPEFLTRKEEDSHEGWAAVNLYQIGGVLHDLIMNKELYSEISPYSNLVIAIKEDAPNISNSSFPFQTNQLARDLLIKDWKKRGDAITKDRINAFLISQDENSSSLKSEVDKVLSYTSKHKFKLDEITSIERSNEEKRLRREKINARLIKFITSCLIPIEKERIFKNILEYDPFDFAINTHSQKGIYTKNKLYKIEGDLSMGLPRPLYLLLKIENDENALSVIKLLGIFLGNNIVDEDNPEHLLMTVRNEVNRNLQASEKSIFNPTMKVLFSGVFNPDEQLKDTLTLELLRFITDAVLSVEGEVNERIERQKTIALGNRNHTILFSSPQLKTILYNGIS